MAGDTRSRSLKSRCPTAGFYASTRNKEVNPGPGKGCYWDEHEIERPKCARRLTFPNWEWADRDGQTLAWAGGGCRYRAPLLATKIGEARTLFDFNGMKFERLVAPY